MSREKGHCAFAIVGTGDAGRRHAKAIARLSQAQVVLAYDADPVSSRQFAGECGATPVSDLDALLASDDIDAVSICTPPATHVPLALAAVARGKHILVEKPFALDVAGIDAVTVAARARGVIAGAVSQHRFSGAAIRLGNLLESGSLGAVVAARISVRRHRPPTYYSNSWKGDSRIAGGGTLFSLGVHTLDLACSLIGQPRRGFAFMNGVSGASVETVVAGALLFGSSTALTLDMAAGSGPTQPDELELFCENGRAIIVGDELRVAGEPPTGGRENLHERQIAEFVRSVSEGSPAMPGPAQVRPAIAAITALYASSASGRWEEVES